MCGGSNCNNLPPFDSEMEDKNGILHKSCSKLLELAATDDLAGFIHEVEERGVNVNEARFWYGRSFGSKKMGFEERTPIMIASLYGSTHVLDYILQTCKVDVNKACGSDGATALHCAAAGGAWSSLEVIELLLGACGDINTVDANGKKPGDLIAPCVKSSSSSRRKTLEMLLNGVTGDGDELENGCRTPSAVEKKEYPMDVSLPDINTGVYGSDEFRMYSFKVKPCSRAYSHDWTECPFVHPGENARRRDPRKFSYSCVPCPEFKKGTCAKADSCEYAHGVFESWLHPAQYRTRLCKDEVGCARKVCFFAHKPEELRPLYAATGSAMPSPKAVGGGSLEMATLSPLSLGSSPLMSPVACSSPMWQSKVNLAPPALQLSGSRLKTSLAARDVDLDMDLLSQYSRVGDLKPTNLDEFFGSLDPSMLSHMQSPTGRIPNTSHLRASFPLNAPSRNPSAYAFDSSAAVASAIMNSRSSSFAKRSQSFVDRGGVGYRSGHSGSPRLVPSKLSDWGSPDGKLDWGFNGEDASKLRKSASFGFRSGDGAAINGSRIGGAGQQHGGVHEMMPHWIDQMYMEQEQMVA